MPQLLSLDTSAIAVAWQVLFAREFHVPLRWSTLVITASAVWVIYVADHLLDTRGSAPLSVRHGFVRAHRRGFILVSSSLLVGCVCCLIWIPVPTLLSGLALSLAVLVYAAIVHFSADHLKADWPKELIVGVLFASGSAIATWSYPHLAKATLSTLLPFIGLCSLNCAMLEFQEWQKRPDRSFPPHPSTQWIGQHCGGLTICLLVALVAVAWFGHHERMMLAMALSATLQFLIVRLGRNWQADSVRALADASLLTPLLMLWR